MTGHPHDTSAVNGSGHVMHRGHGPVHDLLAWVFFAGRRASIYRRLSTLSGAGPGDRVIDIGCGDGYLSRQMADRVGPIGTVVGVDPSPEAIERARQMTSNRVCEFAEGVAEDVQAPDSSCDVVVSSLAIHHLAEASRPAAFAEMWRVLRPGGRVLVAEFRPPTNRFALLLTRPFASANMQHNPIQQLPGLIRAAGFDQVRTDDLRPWIHVITAHKPADHLI